MGFPAFAVIFGVYLYMAIPACNEVTSADITKDTAVAALDMKNVSYGSDTAQKIDVYLPARRDIENTKVILFIHGGSWVAGDKMEFDNAIAALHPELPGYAMFNMNYRLASGQNRFPVQISDIQSAMKFIEGKADDYNINASKICLVGASAGAHLALLQAYANNHDRRIKAVVDLFGPADLKDLYVNHPIPQEARYVLMNLLGKTPSSNPDLYNEASPINFVNAHTVPTLIFHGTGDIVVPIAQSNALKAKLLANKVKVQMTSYAGEGHGWYGKNLVDTYAKTIEFIKENVQ